MPAKPPHDAASDATSSTDAASDATSSTDAGVAPTLAGCVAFPDDHVLRVRVDALPTHPRSSAFLARMRSVAGPTPRVGMSAFVFQGSRAGIPTNSGGTETTLATDGSYGLAIGLFTMRLPSPLRIEGEPNPAGAWDRHVLDVDETTCLLTEVINYRVDPTYGPLVSGGVRWDLRGYARESPVVGGGGVAEAAGLPIAPLVVRFDEVASGTVRHPIRITSAAIASTGPLFPATRTDGRDTHPDAMPMGARLRLRADADLSALAPSARVLATAMQAYGLVVADSVPDGGGWVITGEGDARWDDAELATLTTLDLAAFEVVDMGSLDLGDGSLRARMP